MDGDTSGRSRSEWRAGHPTDDVVASGDVVRLGTLAKHYPVIIIGGGINGCGLFRDLCAQGVDCLLVEAKDFCSGASAAPSRLIHGGIKYLETGEFGLVRQSLLERNRLLRNAPHYVKPLETVLPVYSRFGGIVPSIRRFFRLKATLNDRGALVIKAGLLLYDLFGRHVRTMPTHRMLGRAEAMRRMPDLTPRILAAGLYHEAHITHAERLGLELVLDGLADNHAANALNHVSVVGAGAGGLTLRDALDGSETTVAADIIVNAGGAWIDKVNSVLGIDTHHMGGSKGSHLVVRNPRLHDALGGRMIYFGSADGRVNLLYPFMGNVLIGSTDIPVADPDSAECDASERDYLSGITREVFPDIRVRPEDIIMTYCGVRPLPSSEGVDPGDVSRDHSIAENVLPGSMTPIYSLIGGKWTTFRGFSEEVADLSLRRLNRQRRCSTRDMPIGGGRFYPANRADYRSAIAELAKCSGLQVDRVDVLFARYGTRCGDYLDGRKTGMPEKSFSSLPSYSGEEIGWICRNEKVGRLTDLLFRRTDIALSGKLSAAVLAEVAQAVAPILNWPADRVKQEVREARLACQRNNMTLEAAGSPGTADGVASRTTSS